MLSVHAARARYAPRLYSRALSARPLLDLRIIHAQHSRFRRRRVRVCVSRLLARPGTLERLDVGHNRIGGGVPDELVAFEVGSSVTCGIRIASLNNYE